MSYVFVVNGRSFVKPIFENKSMFTLIWASALVTYFVILFIIFSGKIYVCCPGILDFVLLTSLKSTFC